MLLIRTINSNYQFKLLWANTVLVNTIDHCCSLLFTITFEQITVNTHIISFCLSLSLSFSEEALCAPDLKFCFNCTFVLRTGKMLKQSDAHSMPAERILVFRSRSRSYLGGIFLPSNFSGAPPRASASTNEDGGRVVASAARRLRP